MYYLACWGGSKATQAWDSGNGTGGGVTGEGLGQAACSSQHCSVPDDEGCDRERQLRKPNRDNRELCYNQPQVGPPPKPPQMPSLRCPTHSHTCI